MKKAKQQEGRSDDDEEGGSIESDRCNRKDK